MLSFVHKFKLDVKKLPKYPDFNKTFRLPVDYDLCECIAKAAPPESIAEFKHLMNCIKHNQLECRYTSRYGIGRYYPMCPKPLLDGKPDPLYQKFYSSLCNMPKRIKETIFHYGGYVDFDQVKGHVTILYDMATAQQIDLPAYREYLTRFDELTTELIAYYSSDGLLTKQHIKNLFNRTIYGGGHAKWVEDLTAGLKRGMDNSTRPQEPMSLQNTDVPHDFYCRFKQETEQLIHTVYYTNPEIQELVCKTLPDLEKNLHDRKSKVMSYFCGTVENYLTYEAYTYAWKHNMCKRYEIDWGYDGFTFPNKMTEEELATHVTDMNAHLQKKTGLKSVCFIQKPFTHVMDVSYTRHTQTDLIEANTDYDAAVYMLSELKNHLLSCDRRVYMKKDNVWICEPDVIQHRLVQRIMESDLCSITPAGHQVFKYKDFHPATRVYQTLLTLLQESSFDKRLFHTTTKYKLAFQNGVLDLKQKIFTPWSQIDFPYYTTQQIQSDYSPVSDPNAFNSLVESVFVPIFGSQSELALRFLSRALAGCIEDKNFATYVGNRNCGKGVLYSLLQAFGGYVGAFNLESIATNGRKEIMSTPRDFYWLLDLEFTRLAMSQEVSDTKDFKLKSDVVKRICSGGDTIVARRNFDKRDTYFNLDVTLFALGNEHIETANDVYEHRLCFEGSKSFISKEQYDSYTADGLNELEMNKYLIADDKIKEKCRSPEYHRFMVALLLDRFVDEPIKVNITEVEDLTEDSSLTQLLEKYTLTKCRTDIVIGTDITNLFGKKIKQELRDLGVDYFRCRLRGTHYNQWCYRGILLKAQDCLL